MTLHADIALDDYHGHESVSHSKLKDFDQLGPKGYYLRHVRGEAPRKDTAALIAGRAFETFLFEPSQFSKWFAVKPEGCNFTKPEWKAWKKEQESTGRSILDRDDFLAFEHMKRAIDDCGAARALLEGCLSQPTFRVDWPGLPGFQARPDMANLDGCPQSDFKPFSLDLKTCRSLDELTSARAIVKYGYHSQAATVRLAAEDSGFAHYLLAAEKAFPCRAMVIEVSRVFVDIGEAWARRTADRLAECYAASFWPLTEQDSMVVEPPAWLLAQHAVNDMDDDMDEAAP